MNEADPITLELDREGTAERTCGELLEALYHSRPEWSVSQFKMLAEPNPEPELFWGRHVAKFEDWQLKITPAMQMGSAIHEAILQKHELRIIPADVLASNGQKRGKAWEEFAAEHQGQVWLKEEEAEPARNGIDAFWKNKKAAALLNDGLAEHSLFWYDEMTGLPLRCRIDFFSNVGNGVAVDLKVTTSPTPYDFPWKCLDLKYHIQAATYLYGIDKAWKRKPDYFMFITLEPEPPYRCCVHVCREEMLDLGYTRMKEALLELKERRESGNWHSLWHNKVNALDLPKKAYPNPFKGVFDVN